MPRKRTVGPTDREAEILSILWDEGSADVEQIRQRLGGRPSANTVRTLLTIMVERGLVKDDGKSYGRTYRPRMPRQQVRRRALSRVLTTLFAGSAEELILHLVDEGEVDADKLAELQQRIARGQEGEQP